MDKTKAALTVLAVLAGLVWAGSRTDLPMPGAVRDVAIGIAGATGLAIGPVARAIGAVAGPLAVVLRVFGLPIILGLICWQLLRGRRARG